ncbi:MAG TPA: DUF853 family protein, partial [Parvularculaceae bacterium]|nr:DUF853 family protein [Parvularculaceae bacterium]
MTDGIFIGKGEAPQCLALKYANRHGLIAGATGTGKTVTLQILAEDSVVPRRQREIHARALTDGNRRGGDGLLDRQTGTRGRVFQRR